MQWWIAAIASVLCGIAAGPARAQQTNPAEQPSAEQSATTQRPAAAEPSAPPPRAGEGVEACLAAHLDGQKLRQSGQLLESRERFRRCAEPGCPTAIVRDCVEWLGQYERRIPSITVRVTADGKGRPDARVLVDGNAVEGLDGKAIELDPGQHLVRVELPPFAPFETSLLISEGDQFRVVEAAFASATHSLEPQSDSQHAAPVAMERPMPTLAYVFGAVTLAAAANGAGWALSSSSLRRAMEKQCAPGCNPETVAVLRQRATITDISWGVSAASFIATVTLYALRPEVPVPSEQPIGFGVNVLTGGAIGSVSLSAF